MATELHPLDEHFLTMAAALPETTGEARRPDEPIIAGTALTVARALELFQHQCESRHADLAAIWMQSQGRGYYTIGISKPGGWST